MDINILRNYEKEKKLKCKSHPLYNIFIWNYSEIIQFTKDWDNITTNCRGLITDDNGNIIARSFPKFFNLGEINISQIPNSVPRIFEKLDGSLGILFFYKKENVWIFASRGSFTSEQAVKGFSILEKNHPNYINLDKDKSYIFEVIYPENKIVVNYGNDEKLVYLSSFDTQGNEYLNIEEMKMLGYNVAKEFKLDDLFLDDLFKLNTEETKTVAKVTDDLFKLNTEETKTVCYNAVKELETNDISKNTLNEEVVREFETNDISKNTLNEEVVRELETNNLSKNTLNEEVVREFESSDISKNTVNEEYATKEFKADNLFKLKSKNIVNEEGYVARYDNGFRLKIKFDTYLAVHKNRFSLSVKSIYEFYRDNKEDQNFIETIPDEFMDWFKKVKENIFQLYNKILNECKTDFEKYKSNNKAEFAKKINNHKYKKILFSLYSGKDIHYQNFNMIDYTLIDSNQNKICY
jgi:RNA ligase